DTFADDLHLRLRRCGRHTSFEASCDIQVVALIRTVRIRLEWNPDVGFRIRMKTVRQDADHVVRNAVQQDRTADYVTGTAEPHLPHAVTKHRDGRTMGQILSLRKGAS